MSGCIVTLKQETAKPPAAHRRAQQRAMDQVSGKNTIQVTTARSSGHADARPAVYEASAAKIPGACAGAGIPGNHADVRRAQQLQGHFRWKNHHDFSSVKFFWGERVRFVAGRQTAGIRSTLPHNPTGRGLDSRQLRISSCRFPSRGLTTKTVAGQGECVPFSPPPHPPLNLKDEKVSGMCRSKVSGIPPAVQESPESGHRRHRTSSGDRKSKINLHHGGGEEPEPTPTPGLNRVSLYFSGAERGGG